MRRVLRDLRADTPPDVLVLAILGLAGTGAVGLALAFPVSTEAPRRLLVGMMTAGLVTATLLLAFRTRVRPWMIHALIAGRSIALGTVIAAAATRSGASAIALMYIWSAIYAAVFFSRRAAHAHVALMIGAYGLGTLLGRAPVNPTVWVIMSATIAVAATVLGDLSARLREQAQSDTLTGLLNRGGFSAAAGRERAIADRRGTDLVLAVIDLDDFKLVNDLGGHAAGDRLLVDLAASWRASLRACDLLARHGGDEFVVLLPDMSEDEADAVLERLAAGHPGRWTAGRVTWMPGESVDAAIARADAALYAAKAGRRAERERLPV